MPVLYNSTALVPAPFVAISKQENSSGEGATLGSIYQITLKGNLVAVPPGTTAVEEAARLGVLLTKQKNLSSLFSVNGKVLEFYSPDGTGVTQCNPIVKSIEFAEGIWVDRTEYTITLEAYKLYPDDIFPADFVTDIVDNWQIEEQGFTILADGSAKPVWQMTRTVSAKGQLIYDSVGTITIKPWERARSWVVGRIASSVYPFDAVNELNIKEGSSTAYNHTRTESVDVIEGTFSITEVWVLAYDLNVVEDYTVSLRYTPEENTELSVSISGTIKGLATGLNNLQGRIANAIAYWNGTAKGALYDRASLVVPDFVLSQYASSANVDYQTAEGQVTYTYEYNTKSSEGDSNFYDTYVVSRKSDITASEISVTVEGNIVGRLLAGEPNSNLLKYQRAKARFDAINNTSTMFGRALQSGVGDLKEASVSSSQNFEPWNGTISYSYEFNNRLDNLAKNEYTVSLRSTRDDGKSSVSVEGTVTGLKQFDTDPYTVKFANALAFYNGFAIQLPSIINGFEPTITLNPNPASRSRGENRYQGVVTYALEYDTSPIPTVDGAIYQKVNITYNDGGPVFAIIPVIGEGLPPVFQDINARKEKSKTLNIDIITELGFGSPDTDSLVASYQPDSSVYFVENDEWSFDEVNHYTRTVVWKIRE